MKKALIITPIVLSLFLFGCENKKVMLQNTNTKQNFKKEKEKEIHKDLSKITFILNEIGEDEFHEEKVTVKLVDGNNKILKEGEGYDGLGICSEGIETFGDADFPNKFGLRKYNNEKIKDVIFDDIGGFKDGISRASINGKYGYIDKSGEFIIKPQFDIASKKFNEGLASVQFNGKYGYIDKSGNIIIEPKFDDARDFSEGLAIIKVNNKYGFIDKTGKIIIEPKFNFAKDFKNGLACIGVDTDEVSSKEKNYGYINKEGKTIIEPKFKIPSNFSEGLALNTLDNKTYGYIDKVGEFKIKPKDNQFFGFMFGETDYNQSNLYEFCDGLAMAFSKDDNGDIKGGYIDKNGEFKIKPKFNNHEPFIKYSKDQKAVATIRYDGKWGVIDSSGKYVIKPNVKYESIYCNIY